AEAHSNLGVALSHRGRQDQALAELKEAIRLKPHSAQPYMNLAVFLAIVADPKLRDPAEAVKLARKAVGLLPHNAESSQGLGWARCQSGACKESIEAFHKSMELQQNRKGGDSGQWFGLAVAHWQLRDKDEARKWYDKAVQWLEKNAPDNEELRRYRAEAEKV